MNDGRTCNICIFSCFRGVAVEESLVENETVTKVHLPLRARRSNQAWIHEWLSTRSYGHTFDCNFEDRRRDALSARSFGGYAWVIFNYDSVIVRALIMRIFADETSRAPLAQVPCPQWAPGRALFALKCTRGSSRPHFLANHSCHVGWLALFTNTIFRWIPSITIKGFFEIITSQTSWCRADERSTR